MQSSPLRAGNSPRWTPAEMLALVVWIATLILNGTYLRHRVPGDTSIDWVIASRLVAAMGGILLGGYMIMTRVKRVGTGGRIVMAYVGIAFISAILSQYSRVALGYWLQLAGLGFVTVGLVSCQTSVSALVRIETLYTIVLTILVLKDAITGYLSPELQADIATHVGYTRLGAGLISPNALGLSAAIVCWLSFRSKGGYRSVVLWLIRIALVVIVLLTRSRIALISLILAGLIRLCFYSSPSRKKTTALRAGIILSVLAIGCMILFLMVTEFTPVVALLSLFNRGEDAATIASATGRTAIWSVVIRSTIFSVRGLSIGHGYGTSPIPLEGLEDILHFPPPHTHNTLLEFLLTMGVPGAALFFAFCFYGARWVRVLRMSDRTDPSYGLALRATVVLVMVFISSMGEVYVATKINPVLIVMLLYITMQGQVRNILKHDDDEISEQSSLAVPNGSVATERRL